MADFTSGGLTPGIPLTGARLGKLADLINEHDLDSVSVLDARYQATLGRGPWVASITVTHIGKPG